MKKINSYIIEKLRINKDSKNINIKERLYLIIQDSLNNELNFTSNQYIISDDYVNNNEKYFIIKQNPNSKRRLTNKIRDELYDIVIKKAKLEGIENYIIGKNNEFENLNIYYKINI